MIRNSCLRCTLTHKYSGNLHWKYLSCKRQCDGGRVRISLRRAPVIHVSNLNLLYAIWVRSNSHVGGLWLVFIWWLIAERAAVCASCQQLSTAELIYSAYHLWDAVLTCYFRLKYAVTLYCERRIKVTSFLWAFLSYLRLVVLVLT